MKWSRHFRGDRKDVSVNEERRVASQQLPTPAENLTALI